MKLIIKKKVQQVQKVMRTKKAIGLQDIYLCMIASASGHEFRNGGLSFVQIQASGWVEA